MDGPTDGVDDVLGEARWPATGAELVALAEEKGASPEVLDDLRALPPRMTFSSTTEVTIRIRQL